MKSNHIIIEEICSAIGKGVLPEAKSIIKNKYPFILLKKGNRSYTNLQKTGIFIRDGFTDRYSGKKLVFPPVLRILSILMPDEFPYHSNWKMSECHMAYWHLFPTIDHIIPVARGGTDDESNWVCTSQLRNSSKANWLLEELGWQLHRSGSLNEWDGLLNWFVEYVAEHPEILEDSYIQLWHTAAVKAAGLNNKSQGENK